MKITIINEKTFNLINSFCALEAQVIELPTPIQETIKQAIAEDIISVAQGNSLMNLSYPELVEFLVNFPKVVTITDLRLHNFFGTLCYFIMLIEL